MSNRRRPNKAPGALAIATQRHHVQGVDEARRVAAELLADASPDEARERVAYALLASWAFQSRWSSDEASAIYKTLETEVGGR